MTIMRFEWYATLQIGCVALVLAACSSSEPFTVIRNDDAGSDTAVDQKDASPTIDRAQTPNTDMLPDGGNVGPDADLPDPIPYFCSKPNEWRKTSLPGITTFPVEGYDITSYREQLLFPWNCLDGNFNPVCPDKNISPYLPPEMTLTGTNTAELPFLRDDFSLERRISVGLPTQYEGAKPGSVGLLILLGGDSNGEARTYALNSRTFPVLEPVTRVTNSEEIPPLVVARVRWSFDAHPQVSPETSAANEKNLRDVTIPEIRRLYPKISSDPSMVAIVAAYREGGRALQRRYGQW